MNTSTRKVARKSGTHRLKTVGRFCISLLAALVLFMQLAPAGFATENAGGGAILS